MATKKVNLVISLKDNVSSKLKSIGGGLKKVRAGFGAVAIAGAAMATALIGGLTALTKAYAEQESVNNKMKATFDAAGESGAAAVAQWGAFATSIQRVTALGDEEIMNLITLGKTMGLANEQLKGATKGAIGLSKAFGIDMASSMKMVALAQQGEFEMLQRYIPALREATTEAEKQAIVTEAMANGFKVAQAELDTISGSFAALKGVIGDAMQVAGEAIAGGGGFQNIVTGLKEAIIDLTESGNIEYWASEVKDAFEAIGPVIDGVTWTINKAVEGWQAIFGTLNKLGAFIGTFTGGLQAGQGVGESFTEAKGVAGDYAKDRAERKKSFLKSLQEEKAAEKQALDKVQKEAKQKKIKDVKEVAKVEAEEKIKVGEEVAKKVAEVQVEELKAKTEEAAPEIAKAVAMPIASAPGPTGTTGFAELSAQMSGQGVGGFERRRVLSAVASAEKMGRKENVSGLGSIAGDLAQSGLRGFDLRRAIEDALSAELLGREASEENAVKKTNSILEKIEKNTSGGLI